MTKLFKALIYILGMTGQSLLLFLEKVGSITSFALKALSYIVKPPFYFGLLGKQILEIGYFSVPVVGMTTLFAGMVLALQSYTGVDATLAESAIPTLVVLAITRELAPVLAGLMVAGRIGASIAAEIGTMRVSEQIDAMQTLDTDPFGYLVLPRLLAGILILPLLVLMGDVIGVFGGYIVGVYKLGFSDNAYITYAWEALDNRGVISGLVKAACFGFIISLMGCYYGYNSKGGAEGVGAATTYAVVGASILILITNYIVTFIFFGN